MVARVGAENAGLTCGKSDQPLSRIQFWQSPRNRGSSARRRSSEPTLTTSNLFGGQGLDEGGEARVVVEGVEANAFQYMTGGVALVLGSIGFNLGAGLTGGRVYLLDPERTRLNAQYVKMEPLDETGAAEVRQLLHEHCAETASRTAAGLLRAFDPGRFQRVTTAIAPESIE